MSVTHWQLLAEERDRQQRRDENNPVPARIHPGSSFGPHPFVPFADSERHVSCVKCGRPAENPIHHRSEAA